MRTSEIMHEAWRIGCEEAALEHSLVIAQKKGDPERIKSLTLELERHISAQNLPEEFFPTVSYNAAIYFFVPRESSSLPYDY